MNYYSEIKTKLLNNEIYEKAKDYSKERHRVLTYFEIGRLLYEAGKHYGESIIKKYSEKLTKELGNKYSERNLLKMRQFYIVFSDLKWNPVCSKFQKMPSYNDYSSTLSANSKHKNAINKGNSAITNSNRITLSADLIDKNISTYMPIIANLTWSHYTELISIKDINKMMYYLQISAEQRLDVRSLRSKIKSKEYERLDPETRTKLMLNNDLNIKDYVPNPILIKNNSGKEEISEKLLHALIMEDIGSFMKELGDGYCFIDSEYKLKINDRYNYIDLLFYNLRFRCYVVIELKVT